MHTDFRTSTGAQSVVARPVFASAGPLAPAGLRAPHSNPPSPSLPLLPSRPVTSDPYIPLPSFLLEVGPLKSS